MLTVWMMYGIPEWMVSKGFWMIGLELEIWVVACWFLYYCVCVNDKTYFCWALANIPVHSLLVWLITPSFFSLNSNIVLSSPEISSYSETGCLDTWGRFSGLCWKLWWVVCWFEIRKVSGLLLFGLFNLVLCTWGNVLIMCDHRYSWYQYSPFISIRCWIIETYLLQYWKYSKESLIYYELPMINTELLISIIFTVINT